MRLATMSTNSDSGTTAAVVDGARAFPVSAEDGSPIADVGALLASGRAEERVLAALEPGGAGQPLEENRLRRPILDPGAVVCVGLNYRTHILEMNQELPESPTLFSKLPRALTDPFATVSVPLEAAAGLDYEGEVAVVIGKTGRNVALEDAWSHVAGLTIINDVSMRDFQRRTVQWFAGKTWQCATPMGPWLVTVDEIGDIGRLELTTRVNGEIRQQASLGDLVFDIPALVADLSRIIKLAPGDVVATGTPGGVGDSSKNYLRDGDEVEVEVTEIGTIHNTVSVT